MTSKVIYSIPDTQIGLQAVEFLKTRGMDDSLISVLGNESSELSAIPDPGEYENDVGPAAARGGVVGGATGLLIGLGAAVVAPGLAVGGAALALAAAGGATFGVLASSLIGSSVPHSQIQEYQEVIDRGELLMIVEFDNDQASGTGEQLLSRFTAVKKIGEVDAVPPIV